MSRSLARQSVLVAVVAALVDTTVFALSGVFAERPAQAAVIVIGTVAADLALAAPPRTAGVVAVAQVALRLVSVALLHGLRLPMRVADVGLMVAGYRAGAWLSGATSMAAVAMLTAAVTASDLLAGGSAAHDLRLLAVGAVATGVVPWLVGRYTTARGAYIAELELERQQHRAALDRALTDEREAIARDLHDVISHHVSAIGIHAGAARLALGAPESAATTSLAAVESSSRAAMVDLRRQLDLLHGRADAGERQPGLADIEELLAHVRGAGLEVSAQTSGAATPLPPSLDVIVYRIVQETLTNALRHGDGAAQLAVRCAAGYVIIEESNTVVAQFNTDNTVHHGLAGIRRRAELFGGTVEYGASASTGRAADTGRDARWRIHVSIPIGSA